MMGFLLQAVKSGHIIFNVFYRTKSTVRVVSYDNLFPQSSKKILNVKKHEFPPIPKELRVNYINMQMLSRNIYNQIFKKKTEEISDDLIHSCLFDLEKHGMNVNDTSFMPDIELNLPPLEGENLEEHFQIIGEQQCGPYRYLVNELLVSIPEVPKEWCFQLGWTRYEPGKEPEQVNYPLEDGLVFDVEICVQNGRIPTLATAVSTKAWYGWVSQEVINGITRPVTNHHYNLSDLIPLESTTEDMGFNLPPRLKKPKVAIGHNVSFDRAKVKEQYWFEKTGMRFVDTMSLHICVSGITSYQRAVLKAKKDIDLDDEKWRACSSLNSLSEVHKLYCGSELDKSTRDIFVEGTIEDIKNDFQNMMHYCGKDVLATYNVLRKLFPLFLERFPHPVTFAGMLELGMAYLPVNANWNRYINDSEQVFEDLQTESRFLLMNRADQACHLMHGEKYKEDLWMWDQDWSTKELKMKKTITKQKNKKQEEEIIKNEISVEENLEETNEDLEYRRLENKFHYLFETKHYLPVRRPLLPGYPMWYCKICTKPDSDSDWKPGPHLISTSMQITPKLLKLSWEGYPLHYIRDKGWGFLVPHSEEWDGKTIPLKQLIAKCPVVSGKTTSKDGELSFENYAKELDKNLNQKEWWRNKKRKKDNTEDFYKGTGVWCNVDLENCCWFLKLPHKDGVSQNVGNPLARDFLNKFSDNVLAGEGGNAEKVLSIARMLSYWRNNRDRIMEQVVVWLKENEIPKIMQPDIQFGAIIPQVVVCGTLTRRAVEATWMTASNAHKERIGSELRSMIQAPPGYSIVGADVDSQELWIAATIGDAYRAKMHGATPLGWMTLIGNKSAGTDMHSVTAKAVGISRDHSKIINYARIYGAGQNFAERLLKQFNPSMSASEAKSKAIKMFALTKGKRFYKLKKEYENNFEDKLYGLWQALQMSKLQVKSLDEMFEKVKWEGGSESAMFNRLEEIAGSPHPVTPFLGGRLSRALEPHNMSDDRFLPTKINWVVQSGAADFLHLMLVSMCWLMKNQTRFCLSFHDEVRYLVPDCLKYDAALAMHITNLLTRSFCSIKLGIHDLPQSVAFFSSVEVDKVLRKDSNSDCKTPSNLHGLEKGYGIPNGESLTIQDCITKTGGEISLWKKEQRNVSCNKAKTCNDGSTEN